MDAHCREAAGAINGMVETYGRSLVGVSVSFTGPSIRHGRIGIVVEEDTASRSLVVEDDAGVRHAITFDSLLPW